MARNARGQKSPLPSHQPDSVGARSEGQAGAPPRLASYPGAQAQASGSKQQKWKKEQGGKIRPFLLPPFFVFGVMIPSTHMKPTDMRRRALQIVRGLARLYPDAACALHYETPLQLLIATILSAQCTDVRVNLVTPALFARYPDAAAFAAADPRELETYIQSTGFFRNKARNIIACCRLLVEQHAGE